MKMKFKGAMSRGFCGVLAQTILEISGSQLNPLIGIFSEQEDITLTLKEQANHGHYYRLFEDAQKQLEKFSLNFSSCNPFLSSPSTAKDTC